MTGQNAMNIINFTDDFKFVSTSISEMPPHASGSEWTDGAHYHEIPIVNQYSVEEAAEPQDDDISGLQNQANKQQDEEDLDHHTWTGTRFVPDHQYRQLQHKQLQPKLKTPESVQTTIKLDCDSRNRSSLRSRVSRKRRLSRNLSSFNKRSKNPLLGKSR